MQDGPDPLPPTCTEQQLPGDPLALPTAALRSAAFDQWGETAETRLAALTQLRARIEALPAEDRLHDLGDANLMRFIRNRKFDVDKALATTVKLKRFYTAHTGVCVV